jgi:hypothetical protein
VIRPGKAGHTSGPSGRRNCSNIDRSSDLTFIPQWSISYTLKWVNQFSYFIFILEKVPLHIEKGIGPNSVSVPKSKKLVDMFPKLSNEHLKFIFPVLLPF